MAKKKEPTVEEKLRALYDLQLIDSRIDKIRDIRGELPLEVRDLEDDIEGLNTRIEKVNASLKELEDQISYKKNSIDEAMQNISLSRGVVSTGELIIAEGDLINDELFEVLRIFLRLCQI